MRKINKNKRMAIFLLNGSGKRAQVHPGIARLCGCPAAKTISQTHSAKKWPQQVRQFFIEFTLSLQENQWIVCHRLEFLLISPHILKQGLLGRGQLVI